MDGIKGEMYNIDPKAIDKEKLYGDLDGTTLEWTDGIFTSILRRILDNQKGESERRHWIVFDGDVDPECRFPREDVVFDLTSLLYVGISSHKLRRLFSSVHRGRESELCVG